MIAYEFGEWIVEADLGRIRRERENVHLEPKTLSVLTLLLDEADEVVSKEKLFRAVWPDRVVEPNVVARNISLLRQALGDGSRTNPFP